MSNDLSSSFDSLFSKLENFITTKTVVGEPTNIGDVILVPLVEVSFGVGAGSIANSEEKANKDSGAGGLGAKVTPSAVIVIIDGAVQLVNVKNQDSVNKLIDMVPGIVSKFNLGSLFNKDTDKTDNVINEDTMP